MISTCNNCVIGPCEWKCENLKEEFYRYTCPLAVELSANWKPINEESEKYPDQCIGIIEGLPTGFQVEPKSNRLKRERAIKESYTPRLTVKNTDSTNIIHTVEKE